GLGHSKAVDVDDPPSNAELGDVLHHRYPFEPNRFEVGSQLLGSTRVTFAELEPGRGERSRQLGALEEPPTRRHDYSQVAAPDTLQRFDTLASDFGVGFRLAETFAGRVEGNLIGLDQRA